MKKVLIIAGILVLILLCAALITIFVLQKPAAETDASAYGTLTKLPENAEFTVSESISYPGNFIAFAVKNAPEAKLSAKLEDTPLPLSACVIDGTLVGLVAVPLDVENLSTLTITAGDRTSEVEIHTKAFETAGADMPEVLDEKTAQQDVDKYEKAIAKGVQQPQWEGLFVLPVTGKILTSFGADLLNEGTSVGQNGGINIAADEGTPVKAANAGTVVFAGELSSGGNTVIISHGLGVFSIYQNMQVNLAAEDTQVSQGDIIGKVGKTGYVKTPQLSYSVVIAGSPVDPQLLTIRDPLDILMH